MVEILLPAAIAANIGESTSINCNVTSSQSVNITWVKDGYPLVVESNMEIYETFLNYSPKSIVSISTIDFVDVQSSDSGWYNCTLASTSNESAASPAVYLIIQKGPLTITEKFSAISSTIATTVATTSGMCAQLSPNMHFYLIWS